MFSMAFEGGFQNGNGYDCDQASDGFVQSDDCEQASDGCVQSDGRDLPGAEVELAVREGHCQVGAEEARLPCHTIRKKGTGEMTDRNRLKNARKVFKRNGVIQEEDFFLKKKWGGGYLDMGRHIVGALT